MHDMSSKGRAIVDSKKIILTTEALGGEDLSIEQQGVIVTALLETLNSIEDDELFVIDYPAVISVTSDVEDSGIFNSMELQYFQDHALEICGNLAWSLFDIGCKVGSYELTEIDDDIIRIDYREHNPCLTM